MDPLAAIQLLIAVIRSLDSLIELLAKKHSDPEETKRLVAAACGARTKEERIATAQALNAHFRNR